MVDEKQPRSAMNLNLFCGRPVDAGACSTAPLGTSPGLVVPSGACRAWGGSLPRHLAHRTDPPGPAASDCGPFCWRRWRGCPGSGATWSPHWPSTDPQPQALRTLSHRQASVQTTSAPASRWVALFAAETLPARAFALQVGCRPRCAGHFNQVSLH